MIEPMSKAAGDPAALFEDHLVDGAERLVLLYESWEQPEQAAQWRAKLAGAADDMPVDVE